MRTPIQTSLLILLVAAICNGCFSQQESEQAVEQDSPLSVGNIEQEPPGLVKPLAQVGFLVSVKNQSDAVLQNIKPELECGCQLVQGLPKELAPGEEYLLKFWIKAPAIGSTGYRIRLITESGETVGQIPLTVQTAATAPRLFHHPSSVHFRQSAGTASPMTFSLVCVEPQQERPLLRVGLLRENAVWKITCEPTKEDLTGDPDHVFRHYQCSISLAELPQEKTRETLVLSFPDGQESVSIPVEIQVLQPITLAPAKFLLHAGSEGLGKQSLHVISRLGPIRQITVPKMDDAPLELRELPADKSTAHTRHYEVVLKQSENPQEFQREIPFEVQTGDAEPYISHTVVLSVQLVPPSN